MEVKYLSRLNSFWRSSLATKGPQYPKKQVFVEGHRGCKLLEPENTLRAFKRAIDLGCDSVELDVWLTKDKQIVVIHGLDDGDISKTTTGKGRVLDQTLAELQKYDAGMGEKIPLFEDVVKLCKGKAFINIEIKPNQPDEIVSKVIAMIDKYNLYDGCCVSSFSHTFLGQVEGLTKGKLELGYLYDCNADTPLPTVDYITSHGHTANLCFADITPELAAAVHKKGMGLMAWALSSIKKEEEWYKKLIDAGTDVLCVNRPDLLIKHLSSEKPAPAAKHQSPY